MKMYFASQELWNEQTHDLTEDVAEGHDAKESNGMKQPFPFYVFSDLSFDGKKVREQIAMCENDTFRLGSRARGVNDFDDRVLVNRFG